MNSCVSTKLIQFPYDNSPGRFYASIALKLVVAEIVLNYDLKLEDEKGAAKKETFFCFDSFRVPRVTMSMRRKLSNGETSSVVCVGKKLFITPLIFFSFFFWSPSRFFPHFKPESWSFTICLVFVFLVVYACTNYR